jgi:hypothetical protein
MHFQPAADNVVNLNLVAQSSTFTYNSISTHTTLAKPHRLSIAAHNGAFTYQVTTPNSPSHLALTPHTPHLYSHFQHHLYLPPIYNNRKFAPLHRTVAGVL